MRRSRYFVREPGLQREIKPNKTGQVIDNMPTRMTLHFNIDTPERRDIRLNGGQCMPLTGVDQEAHPWLEFGNDQRATVVLTHRTDPVVTVLPGTERSAARRTRSMARGGSIEGESPPSENAASSDKFSIEHNCPTVEVEMFDGENARLPLPVRLYTKAMDFTLKTMDLHLK